MIIIFCDIDGVLNSNKNHRDGYSDIESDKLSLLKQLIDKTGADLIITSKMRFENISELRIKAIENGGVHVTGYFDGVHLSPASKANECLGYLQNHYPTFNFDVDNLVIIDDQDDGFTSLDLFSNHYVKVNAETGLTQNDIDIALNILNK